jgi:hypothetical protein
VVERCRPLNFFAHDCYLEVPTPRHQAARHTCGACRARLSRQTQWLYVAARGDGACARPDRSCPA